MSTKINDDSMSLEIDGRVIAIAEFREHTAADRQGAWIVSIYPRRLFTRNQAIMAMMLMERLAAGYGDDDPFVIGWREELSLFTAIGQDYPCFFRWLLSAMGVTPARKRSQSLFFGL